MAPRPGLDTNKVVLAAAELADEFGFHEVTLASVAKKLNVRTPSLYNHVGGLPELHKRLALLGLEQLREVVTDAAIGKSGRSALMDIGIAYVQYVRRRPGIYEAITASSKLQDREVQVEAGNIVDVILKVLSVTDIPHEEAIHTVRGLRSIVHGFALLDLSGGFGIPVEPDESLRHILKIFFDGLYR